MGHLALLRGGRPRPVWECDPARAPAPRWPARRWASSSTRPPRWTRAGSASTSPRTSATAASTASRPQRWPNLVAPGRLEIATVAPNGSVTLARRCPTRRRPPRPRASRCRGARRSHAARASGSTAASSTWPPRRDNKVHAYDTRWRRIEVIYDAAKLTDPPLTGVDNITVARSGDLYVCEDNGTGELDIVLITPGPPDRPLPHGHRRRTTPTSELTRSGVRPARAQALLLLAALRRHRRHLRGERALPHPLALTPPSGGGRRLARWTSSACSWCSPSSWPAASSTRSAAGTRARAPSRWTGVPRARPSWRRSSSWTTWTRCSRRRTPAGARPDGPSSPRTTSTSRVAEDQRWRDELRRRPDG